MREDELMIAIAIAVFVMLIPFIFYLITLQKLLEQVSPANRQMPPANVWLMMIPLFNLVYMFLMNTYISDSLAKEYNERNITPNEPRPGFNLGLAKCICRVSGVIPVLGVLGTLGWLVIWIIYWVQMGNHLTTLRNNQGTGLYNELKNV